MRSIRLSLTVYFLVLLAVALGTASVLAYRTTKQTLVDKEKAAQELVQARYEEECRKEQEHLDRALLKQAQTVAQFILFQPDWARLQQFHRDAERWKDEDVRRRHQTAELLSAGMQPTPSSFAMLSFWATEPSKNY